MNAAPPWLQASTGGSDALLVSDDLDFILHGGHAFHPPSNRNGLVHRTLAGCAASQHDHAVLVGIDIDLDQAGHLFRGQFSLDLGGNHRILDVFGSHGLLGIGGKAAYRQQKKAGDENACSEFAVHDGSLMMGKYDRHGTGCLPVVVMQVYHRISRPFCSPAYITRSSAKPLPAQRRYWQDAERRRFIRTQSGAGPGMDIKERMSGLSESGSWLMPLRYSGQENGRAEKCSFLAVDRWEMAFFLWPEMSHLGRFVTNHLPDNTDHD